jgi:hypothetical protein
METDLQLHEMIIHYSPVAIATAVSIYAGVSHRELRESR